MAKYIRKSIFIDAEQFLVDKKPWPEGVKLSDSGFYIRNDGDIHIRLIEPGCWIVKDPAGGHYALGWDYFENTYKLVEGE